MSEIRIESVGSPFSDHPESATRAALLLFRAEMFGAIPPAMSVTVLDASLMTAVIAGLGAVGVAQGAALRLAADRGVHEQVLLRAIDDALDESEHSPMPAGEWPQLLAVLDADLLGRLLRVSPASLRRYATGDRPTPTPIAGRLHVLALLVADLAGSYNDFGIQRWFGRPRVQLGGRSPLDVLAEDWDCDDDGVLQLRGLAAGLVAAGAT